MIVRLVEKKAILTMGVDIGSATSKCVILAGIMTEEEAALCHEGSAPQWTLSLNGDTAALHEGSAPQWTRGDRLHRAFITAKSVIPSGTGTSGPMRAVESAMADADICRDDISLIVATGYGRNTYEAADERISELTCHAVGAVSILPGVRTVIDIGGQDAKALSISPDGKLSHFVMNDKCAAGTGRFLDVMARVLGMDVADLAECDENSTEAVQISSTCTVFAESEVISQLARNAAIPDLVAGIHKSAASRAAALIKRVGITEPLLMTGGVAANAGVVRALEQVLGVPVATSPYSQIAGALGAALIALEKTVKGVVIGD